MVSQSTKINQLRQGYAIALLPIVEREMAIAAAATTRMANLMPTATALALGRSSVGPAGLAIPFRPLGSRPSPRPPGGTVQSPGYGAVDVDRCPRGVPRAGLCRRLPTNLQPPDLPEQRHPLRLQLLLIGAELATFSASTGLATLCW